MRQSLGDHRSKRPHIYKIIYHSHIATPDAVEVGMQSIRGILEWSRDWNPRHGITGALMLNENKFSQVLEGPSHAVKGLFGHIMCDGRHKDVELLQAGLFHARDFDNWAMAFAGSASEPDIRLASTMPTNDETLGQDSGAVVNLLRWLLDERKAREREAV